MATCEYSCMDSIALIQNAARGRFRKQLSCLSEHHPGPRLATAHLHLPVTFVICFALSSPLLKPVGMTLPCRYFLQGFCREGEKCRFAHHDPGSAALSSSFSSAAPMMHSPFSLLAASTQAPAATSLVDAAVAYYNGPMAPIAPVPQALAEPVLSQTYTPNSLGSAGAFSFGATRPQDVPCSGPSMSSSMPTSTGLGISFPISLPTASSTNGSTTPTAANGTAYEGQLPYKQSPFPGVGTGVAGSSPFKFTGNLEQKFGGWSVSQQPFQ